MGTQDRETDITAYRLTESVYRYNSTMTTFGERVKERRKELRMSQKELAALAKLSQATISEIESGDYSGSRRTAALAKALKVQADWLADGRLPKDLPGVNYGIGEEYLMFSAASKVKGEGMVTEGTYELVARVDGPRLAAGSGEIFWDFEEIDESHSFRSDWMKKKGFRRERCKLWSVRGDSMYPTISDGDLVLINMGDRDVVGGNIYALVTEDGLRIKRLIRRADGVMVMHSDSPYQNRYPPEEIKDQSAAVIGKVVWKAGEL